MTDFVKYPDPRLSARAQSRPVDGGLRETGVLLFLAAGQVQAYGLAAVHVGRVDPVVVIDTADDRAKREYLVMFNPEVLEVADHTAMAAEGSVSLPGIEAPVERPVWADIAFDDQDGIRQTRRFEGFPARVALHEIDQMNGVFFLMRISRLKRDTALRKFGKLNRAG